MNLGKRYKRERTSYPIGRISRMDAYNWLPAIAFEFRGVTIDVVFYDKIDIMKI